MRVSWPQRSAAGGPAGRLLHCASLALALALAAGPASAQETSKDRVSTTARGRATSPADEVSLELTVAASAEEAADAEKKYNDKLARILDALKGKPKEPSSEGRRRRKKTDEAKPAEKKKKATHADEDDEDEETPKRPPKKAKRPADDEDEEPARPAKKKPAEEGSKEGATKNGDKKGEEAKPEEGKGGEKKPDDKKGDEKKPDEKAPDEKKPDEKKPEPPIVVDVKEGNLTFGIRHMSDPNQVRMRRMMNQQGPKEEPEVRFASTITITLKDVSKVDVKTLRRRFAEIVDRATEAGADLGVGPDGDGTPACVRFRILKPETLKAKAYEDAIRAARERAAEMARVAGREVGRVVVIRDNTPLPQGVRPTIQPYTNPYQYVQFANQAGEDVTTDITFECDLYLEFELK